MSVIGTKEPGRSNSRGVPRASPTARPSNAPRYSTRFTIPPLNHQQPLFGSLTPQRRAAITTHRSRTNCVASPQAGPLQRLSTQWQHQLIPRYRSFHRRETTGYRFWVAILDLAGEGPVVATAVLLRTAWRIVDSSGSAVACHRMSGTPAAASARSFLASACCRASRAWVRSSNSIAATALDSFFEEMPRMRRNTEYHPAIAQATFC